MRKLRSPALVAVLALAALGAWSSTASALVTSGNSNSYGLNINTTLTVLNVPVTATIGPVDPSSGSAPPPYGMTNNLASFGLMVPPPVSVSSGAIQTTAASNVDGTPGAKTTAATATVNNLNATSGTTTSLVNISGTIASMALVSGDTGAFITAGSTTLTSATVSILGGVPIALASNPAPNTVIPLIAAGVTFANLILNEQTVTNSGTSASITVNAIDLQFTGMTVPGTGTLTGSEIFSHSFAAQNSPAAVPEPSQVALMGVIAAGLGFKYLKARRGRAAIARES